MTGRISDIPNNDSFIAIERVGQLIRLVRGQKVILDSDLAQIYEVETKTLNRAVKRNIERFPEDFMFQLNKDEYLKCPIGTSSKP
ncbi:MAG: ORF6N domain-containing protein [Deltaproteobacteria bacterium]|nr:ORF6N domain-containing protein [Deltaproteobacteria bacterium]MBN2671647.1 ORF6N domain-containing protein [Deltaproteobacteria bacterium]